MSEYQYYEFQALDRPLSAEAQQEMNRLSSRVQLTATSARFVYNYGNFRGSAESVLAEYFDAMLYLTNWDTRQLMFRFPADAVPAEVKARYHFANGLEWSTVGAYDILNLEFNGDNDGDDLWLEGEGSLSGLLQLREDILRGDLRVLYLAWLKLAAYESGMYADDEEYADDDDEYEDAEEGEAGESFVEPPVPPNLQRLSPALLNFAEFFQLDPDLIAAAAEASPSAAPRDEQLDDAIDLLSADEMRALLRRLLNGEANLDIALTRRLRAFAGADEPVESTSARRTIQLVLAEVDRVKKARLQAERVRAAAERQKRMEKLAPQEQALWTQVFQLVAQKKTTAYDQAVTILKDLRDLAEYRQQQAAFRSQMRAIVERYPTLSGLRSRLNAAHLL